MVLRMVLRQVSGSWWFSYPRIGECELGTEQRKLPVVSAEIKVKYRQEKVSVVRQRKLQLGSKMTCPKDHAFPGKRTPLPGLKVLYVNAHPSTPISFLRGQTHSYTAAVNVVHTAIKCGNQINYSA